MCHSQLWFMTSEPNMTWDFSQSLLRDEHLGVLNTREFRLAEHRFNNPGGRPMAAIVPLPPDLPRLRLAMPQDVAPDYFGYDAFTIVSRRLKDAMAQPEHVLQFIPIELVEGGEQARAREYHLMHILIRQPAIDLERSEGELEDYVNRLTGKPSKRFRFVTRLALRKDLHPLAEIVQVEERLSLLLVSDALAERVLRAGCTGVEFSDPANRQTGKRVERYRTLHGSAERKVGFLN
jgi:hypothetical protein